MVEGQVGVNVGELRTGGQGESDYERRHCVQVKGIELKV